MTARLLAFLFALAAVACSGTPQPIPPPDLDALTLEPIAGGIVLRGRAEAIADEANAVLVFNFAFESGAQSITTVTVDDDGAFEHVMPGALPTDQLRLHALDTETLARSTALDITGGGDGAVVLRSVNPCVALTPADVELRTPIGAGPAFASVEIRNGCGMDLNLMQAKAWFDPSVTDWISEDPDDDPFVLADGESRSYINRFDPDSVGPHHSAFVAKVETFDEVHAITLFGLGE